MARPEYELPPDCPLLAKRLYVLLNLNRRRYHRAHFLAFLLDASVRDLIVAMDYLISHGVAFETHHNGSFWGHIEGLEEGKSPSRRSRELAAANA